jgi:hypothetical protein
LNLSDWLSETKQIEKKKDNHKKTVAGWKIPKAGLEVSARQDRGD